MRFYNVLTVSSARKLKFLYSPVIVSNSSKIVNLRIRMSKKNKASNESDDSNDPDENDESDQNESNPMLEFVTFSEQGITLDQTSDNVVSNVGFETYWFKCYQCQSK